MKITESFVENQTKEKEREFLCTNCNVWTKQLVVQSYTHNRGEDHGGYGCDWSGCYEIVKCRGCSQITFREETYFSEDDYPGEDYEPPFSLYPHRHDNYIGVKGYLNIPDPLMKIYKETVSAYNQKSLSLTAAGIRALVEAICSNQGVVGGKVPREKEGVKSEIYKDNLEGKIYGLVEKHLLTLNQANMLHEHRHLGNEALHELAEISLAELQNSIEIIEFVFNALWEMPQKHKQLSNLRANRRLTK